MLNAIFFDIDDTLYPTTHFAAEARRAAVEALRTLGVTLPAEDLYRELEEVIAEFGSNHPAHFDKLILRLPPRSLPPVNPAILVAGAVIAYHNAKYLTLRPYPDVIPTLRTLAKTPLLRGVISSGLQAKQAEKILRLGIFPYLTPNAVFISEQIGISKPNAKLFQRACAQIGVPPAEAMHVGDHPTHDVDPANEAGMISVLVDRATKHSGEEGRTPPRHTLRELGEILTLLSRDYKVDLPPVEP